MHCCTAVLGEEKAKLRDWAFWLVRAACYFQASLSFPHSKLLYEMIQQQPTEINGSLQSAGNEKPVCCHQLGIFPSLSPSIIESSPVSGRRGERQCGRALRVSVGCRIRWKPQKGPKGNITYHHISFEAETYLGFKHTVRGPVSSQAGAGILCVFPSLINKKGYLDFFRHLLSASF